MTQKAGGGAILRGAAYCCLLLLIASYCGLLRRVAAGGAPVGPRGAQDPRQHPQHIAAHCGLLRLIAACCGLLQLAVHPSGHVVLKTLGNTHSLPPHLVSYS